MRLRVDMKLKTDIVHVTFSSGTDLPRMPYGIVMMSRPDAELFAELLWEGSRHIRHRTVSAIGGDVDRTGGLHVDIQTMERTESAAGPVAAQRSVPPDPLPGAGGRTMIDHPLNVELVAFVTQMVETHGLSNVLAVLLHHQGSTATACKLLHETKNEKTCDGCPLLDAIGGAYVESTKCHRAMSKVKGSAA